MHIARAALILQAIGCLQLSALDPARSLFQYVHEAWKQREGLTVDSVNCIAQSPEGFLFVGTEDGLFRFDGARFARYDRANTPALRDNLVAALERDESGRLWIGMIRGGGLAYYRNGRFGRLPVSSGIDNFGVTSICRDGSGGLWVGTWGNGLLHLQSDRVTETFTRERGLAANVVYALLRARDGSLWIGHWGGGLSRLKGGRVTRFGAGEGLKSDVVWSLHEDPEGGLFAATRHGLFHRRGDGRFRLRSSAGEIVRTLLRDGDGNTWIGSWNGMRRLGDPAGASFRERDGLAADTVRCLFEDREKNLWVGTFRGLSRFRDAPFRTYGRREGLGGEIVQAVAPGRDGRVWLGVDGAGLYEFHEGEFHHRPVDAGRIAEGVLSLAEDATGRLWIAAGGGIVLYAGGRVLGERREPFRGSDNYARLVYLDHGGGVWGAAAQGGVHRLGSDAGMTPLALPPGLAALGVNAMLQDRRGRYWLGTDSGLWRAEGRTGEPSEATRICGDGRVLSLHEDAEGGMWAGTDLDLQFLPAPGGPPLQVPGISSEPVFAIVSDNRGGLWLATPRGVLLDSAAALRTAARSGRPSASLRRFGVQDGLRSSTCNGIGRPAACLSANGEIWFATHEGVAVVRPDRLLENPVCPAPLFEEVEIGRVRRAPAPVITLRNRPGRVAIRFTVPSLRYPERVRFRFRLVGVDEAWREEKTVDRAREVVYEGLPAGRHLFRLIAFNDSGRAGPREAQMALLVPPAHYQRPWFFSALALCAATLAAALAWRRRRQRLLRRPPLAQDEVDSWSSRLHAFMEEEKPHLDPTLRLPDLAAKLGLTAHQLSQVVNEGFGVNFSEFINGLRIEEAKRLLADPRCREYKLLTVAYEAGFRSKATFNQAFKKITGTTPSRFRERNGKREGKKT